MQSVSVGPDSVTKAWQAVQTQLNLPALRETFYVRTRASEILYASIFPGYGNTSDLGEAFRSSSHPWLDLGLVGMAGSRRDHGADGIGCGGWALYWLLRPGYLVIRPLGLTVGLDAPRNGCVPVISHQANTWTKECTNQAHSTTSLNTMLFTRLFMAQVTQTIQPIMRKSSAVNPQLQMKNDSWQHGVTSNRHFISFHFML